MRSLPMKHPIKKRRKAQYASSHSFIHDLSLTNIATTYLTYEKKTPGQLTTGEDKKKKQKDQCLETNTKTEH